MNSSGDITCAVAFKPFISNRRARLDSPTNEGRRDSPTNGGRRDSPNRARRIGNGFRVLEIGFAGV